MINDQTLIELLRRHEAAERRLSAMIEHGPRELAEFAASVLSILLDRPVVPPDHNQPPGEEPVVRIDGQRVYFHQYLYPFLHCTEDVWDRLNRVVIKDCGYERSDKEKAETARLVTLAVNRLVEEHLLRIGRGELIGRDPMDYSNRPERKP